MNDNAAVIQQRQAEALRKLQAMISYLDRERSHALSDAMNIAVQHAAQLEAKDREISDLRVAISQLKATVEEQAAELRAAEFLRLNQPEPTTPVIDLTANGRDHHSKEILQPDG